jgi:serine/threonine protein kinase
MQYLGQNDLHKMIKQPNFNNNNIVSILLQLSKILELSQTKYNFIHGDLKPNNIMVFNYKQHEYMQDVDEKIELMGYTIKLIDFGFSTMKTDKYIIKSNPFTKNITDKFYLDLLFLTINLVRHLKRYNKTDMKIYETLTKILNDLFESINLKISSFMKIDSVNNKRRRPVNEKFNMNMVDHITKLDILYDIIDISLYVNDKDTTIFNDFLPKNFFNIISAAKD